MRRTAHQRLVCATLAFALGVTPAWAETIEQRLERMEREIKELRQELQRRDDADRRRATTPAPAATPPASAAGAPAMAETAPPAEPEAVAAKPADEKESLIPSALRAVTDRVKLGGYGSFRWEVNNLQEDPNTFTYRRFVLTTDANIAPRLRGYLELEFERFRKLELEKSAAPADGGLEVEQTVEGTNESEIALEQAWLQYDIKPWLNFRGGAVLVPLGRFNINHDDNQWDLPRRSLVDRGVPVLPAASAWDELGIGFLGDIEVGEDALLNYEAYVVNGVALDVEFEQIAQTRFPEPGKQVIEVELTPETGTFGQDIKDSKALTGRLAFSPWLGHQIAGSGYWGQYTPDYLASEDLWSLAGDWKSVFGPFEVEGEYVYTRFEGVPNVARSLARVARNQAVEFENDDLESEVEFELANLASSKQGYWLDLRYRFWPSVLSRSFLGWEFDDPKLIATVRGEQVWLRGLVEEVGFAGGRLTEFSTQNRRVDRLTFGLAYRPVPLVVFQLAYEWTNTNHGQSLADVTNYLPAQANEDTAHTFLFGAAFGF